MSLPNRNKKSILSLLLTVAVTLSVILEGLPSNPTKAALAADNPYHAYLALQTSNYTFRDAVESSDYGRDTHTLGEDIEGWDYESTIVKWVEDEAAAIPVDSDNPEISGDSTYTVAISGFPEDTFQTETGWNQLMVSTDIPQTVSDITCTDVFVYIDGEEVYTADSIGYIADEDNYNFRIVDIYREIEDNIGETFPQESIAITFTIGGLGAAPVEIQTPEPEEAYLRCWNEEISDFSGAEATNSVMLNKTEIPDGNLGTLESNVPFTISNVEIYINDVEGHFLLDNYTSYVKEDGTYRLDLPNTWEYADAAEEMVIFVGEDTDTSLVYVPGEDNGGSGRIAFYKNGVEVPIEQYELWFTWERGDAASKTPSPSMAVSKTPAPETAVPEETAAPVEDQDQAFLMFTDGSWNWGNWNTRVTNGFGRDAVITGNGDYAVSINADDWVEYNEDNEDFELSTADGAIVLCVDIQNLCNSPNLDVSEMEVSNVKIYADNKEVSLNDSKILMGDIEGKGNFRMEFTNQYGPTADDPAIDPDVLTFQSSLKVTFTLSGIEEGSSQEAFSCDSDGDGLNDNFLLVSDAVDEWSEAGEEDPDPIITEYMPSAPTTEPIATPTTEPTIEPTVAPTSSPAATPTAVPTETATQGPASSPGNSVNGTSAPSAAPGTAKPAGATTAPGSNGTTADLAVTELKGSSTTIKKSGYNYVPAVKLSWTVNEHADGYILYRSAAGATGYAKLTTISAGDISSYRDAAVKRGGTYYYQIQAYSTDTSSNQLLGERTNAIKVAIGSKLVKPSFTTKRSGNKLKITFKKAAGSNYQIQYRYKGDVSWSKAKIKGKVKKNIRIRLRARNFQIRLRTYSKINGKVTYSKWSAAKTIR